MYSFFGNAVPQNHVCVSLIASRPTQCDDCSQAIIVIVAREWDEGMTCDLCLLLGTYIAMHDQVHLCVGHRGQAAIRSNVTYVLISWIVSVANSVYQNKGAFSLWYVFLCHVPVFVL